MRLLSRGSAILDRTLDLALIPLVSIIFVAQIYYSPAAIIILIIVGAIYTTRNVLADDGRLLNSGFGWVDISTLIVMASEIINYFGSTYKLNTLSSLLDISFLFLLYWTIRTNLKHQYQLVGILIIMSLFGAYFTARVIYVFLPQYHHLAYLQFDDLSNFRERINLLGPEGIPIAEWITLFLMFLPFPVLLLVRYRRKLVFVWPPVVCALLLILLSITITFSRALYISTFSFFIVGSLLCLYFRLFSWRQILIFNVVLGLIFVAIIGFSPIVKPVMTTTSILRTSSQIRSLQGRFTTWTIVPGMARAHPLLGVGSYNFAMQYANYRPPNTVYVGRAFNFLFQLLIEKGVLGLAAYGLLLFSLLKTSFRKLRLSMGDVFDRSMLALFLAAAASVIIRDLSYFSILTNKGVASLLCFMFACSAGTPLSTRSQKIQFPGRTLLAVSSILALITFAFVAIKHAPVSRSESDFHSFSRNFAVKQTLPAEQDIDRAISETPQNAYYIANKALLLASTLTETFDARKFRESKLEFGEEDKSLIRSAISLYHRALELNPQDDSFHHNVAWLYCFLRQPAMAEMHFHRAIEISSDVALYHVSLGLFYEWTNERNKALNEYTQAIRLSPAMVDSDFFHDLTTRLPKEAQDILRADTSYFEDQLANGSDPVFNASLGKLYLYNGQVDAATKRLQESTLQLPSLSRPWLNLGQCYESAQDETEAKLSYERASFLDETDYLVWERLGNLAYQQRQPTYAISYYEKAVMRWTRQSSIHSEEVFRVYRSKYVVPNDIVPTNLLAYSQPSLDRAEVFSRLAEMYQTTGNQASAYHYQKLKEELEKN